MAVYSSSPPFPIVRGTVANSIHGRWPDNYVYLYLLMLSCAPFTYYVWRWSIGGGTHWERKTPSSPPITICQNIQPTKQLCPPKSDCQGEKAEESTRYGVGYVHGPIYSSVVVVLVALISHILGMRNTAENPKFCPSLAEPAAHVMSSEKINRRNSAAKNYVLRMIK